MVVGTDGALPLPWLQPVLDGALHQRRAHALLLQGSADLGALEAAVVLAQTWLCERDAATETARELTPLRRACGQCDACRLVQARSHPDLLLLQTEEARLQSGWLLPLDKPPTAQGGADDDKPRKKASRQIRIDEVRLCNEWASRTSSRGRAKVVVLHPADVLNAQAANALLKTLEEPAAGVRFVLTTADAEGLLPTVRSRCQLLRLPTPATEVAQSWLRAQGVADAGVLLAAAGGKPLLALSYHAGGIDAAKWAALPAAVARGDAKPLAGWPLPRAIDVLLRLCHDLSRHAVGGAPLYFAPTALAAFTGTTASLDAWHQDLLRAARHDGHAWNEGLLLESLCAHGARAMARAMPASIAPPGHRATLPS